MKRKVLRIGLPLLLLAILAGGVGVAVTQPRCCLTWANAVMFKHWGYFPGVPARQVEDLIFAQCHAINCQWQPELEPGGCPSQYGVEQVAASWGLPGYTNPPQWDWTAVIGATIEQRALVFWPVNGVGHAYWCHGYAPPVDPAAPRSSGRLWCTDALNQSGRFWNEAEVWAIWSGWAAVWEP